MTASAEFGSSQEWSSSKTVEIEALAEMTPNSPGTYKMSGFIEMANNV